MFGTVVWDTLTVIYLTTNPLLAGWIMLCFLMVIKVDFLLLMKVSGECPSVSLENKKESL